MMIREQDSGPLKLTSRSLLVPLFTLELVLSAIEGWVVLIPLWTFFPVSRSLPGWPIAVTSALTCWLGALAWWLRPLVRNPGLSPVELALAVARRTPGRALSLRLALWAVLGISCAAWLHAARDLSAGQGFTVVTIVLVHSLAISIIRWAVQHRILRFVLSRVLPESSWLPFQRATLFQRLSEVALVIGAGTGIFLGFFVYLFVPITLEQYLRMETYFPWTAVGLGALWYFGAAPRQLAPLISGLRLVSPQAPLALGVLRRAVHSAQRLPSQLALVKLGFFVAAGLLLGVESLLIFSFTVGQAVLIVCAIVIVTAGASLIEMIWSRSVLRPISAFLMVQPGADQLSMRSPSLRRKMGLSLGGVMIVSVVLLLFWTFVQYGNLRQEQARVLAEVQLRTLLRQVDHDPSAVRRWLDHQRRASTDWRLFLVPPHGAATPPLPESSLAAIRSHQAGALVLPERGLTGVYRRINPSQPALGSLLLLAPPVRSPRESLHLAGLVLFFTVILGIGLTVVFAATADLTRPLSALERRAAAVANGELDTPVLPVGEFDEVGRLGVAVDRMRAALQGKIRAVEQLNAELEAKVQARTAALEQANSELTSAIEALKAAQERLVRSEKLASVGQLVAGIAHEINNPLNAVVNTVDPLVETARRLAPTDAADSTAEELATDIADMARVIRSGAHRAQRIVQALRSLTRQDAEAATTVDLHADVEETLALLKHSLRDIEVIRDFQARQPLRAYRGQLNQAVLNLIANAAAALEGRADGRINIETRDIGDRVEIKVKDNGSGIPAQILPRIFDPFFTTKEVGKGTGLGLSITLRIVERHQGTIRVESDSSGTSFWIQIPHTAPNGTANSR